MDKEKAREYLIFLKGKKDEWNTHPAQKSRIAEETRCVASHWDYSIYCYLNENRATCLFENGFFESDINRSLSLLQEIINDDVPSDEELKRIFDLVQNVTVLETDVTKKELKDYLLDKQMNGQICAGKISFTDKEDLEYFDKLTRAIGLDSNDCLEKIVMRAFF